VQSFIVGFLSSSILRVMCMIL